jgi:hypothetical protein
MSAKEPEITKEEQELLELLDEELALPPLPPDFERNVLARLGLLPSKNFDALHQDEVQVEPLSAEEEQELLELLDEELALPPLPPDFERNVLARLGIPAAAPAIEDDTEPATSTPSSDTPEEHCQIGIEAADDGNYTFAEKHFRWAAEQGNAEAQINLGMLYYHGLGVAIDYVEAATWFRKAAEQGRVHAQFRLGLMYGAGLGVAIDYVEAATWLRKAAEQGHVDAQKALGWNSEKGRGVA